MKLSVLVVLSVCMAVLGQEPPSEAEEKAAQSVVLQELPHSWVQGKLSPSLVKGKLPRPWLMRELPRPLVEGKLPHVWPVKELPRPLAEGELPRPWLVRELPRPLVKEELPHVWPPRKLPRPLVEGELPRPWLLRELPQRYYPLQYHPYHHYRTHPEDGKGVALHPNGATSYIIPQVHGVGKRSAKPAVEEEADPNFAYRYHLGSNYSPYRGHRYYSHPQHTFVYHHQLHRRSAGPQYIMGRPSRHPYHGYPYGRYLGYSYGW